VSETRLIVGLGNPGKRYEKTRHNIGFWVAERLARQYNIKLTRSLMIKGRVGAGEIGGVRFCLLLPLTYMNNSGLAVKRLAKKRGIIAKNILVVCDDLDYAPGRLRLKARGGHGGHGGVRSVIQHLATENFARLKVGIGRPNDRDDIVDFVLSECGTTERKKIAAAVEKAVDCCCHWLYAGTTPTMNTFNTKEKR